LEELDGVTLVAKHQKNSRSFQDSVIEERTDQQVKFLVRELQLKKNDRILDLACGYGRHTNELSRLGYHVTGVDINQRLLKTAMIEAPIANTNPKYIRKDLREFRCSMQFDKIFLLFTYFDFTRDGIVLSNIMRALKIGGLFCLDVMNLDYPFSLFNSKVFDVTEKLSGNAIQYHDIVRRRISMHGNVLFEESFHDVFSARYRLQDIVHILETNHLATLNVYGDFDSTSFKKRDCKRIILVCKSFG